MKVLLVDDDRFVIAALKKGVRWEALGFDEIFTAHNVEEAWQVEEKEQVTLIVSDIDMPRGSGLDFLRKLRKEGRNTPCIFLTNYADFAYAQEAVSLKCYHYFLKPVDYGKLTQVIQDAVKESRAKAADQSGRYLSFWREALLHRESKEVPEEFYDKEEELCLLMVQLYPYYLSSDLQLKSRMNEEVLPLLSSLLTADLPEAKREGSVIMSGLPGWDRYYAVLRLGKKTEEKVEQGFLEKRANAFLQSFLEKSHCPANVYLTPPAAPQEIGRQMAVLNEEARNDLGPAGHVFCCEENRQGEKEAGVETVDGQQVKALLEEENFDGLSELCHAYLESQLQKGTLHARSILNLQIDIVQQLYAYLEKRGIRAHQLFSGEPYKTISACATKSAKDMETYLYFLFCKAKEGLKLSAMNQSVADRVREFVDAHYREDIGRESLEEILYFDPDYSSRLFKKETGMSFMHYVIQKRMTEAKRLLLNSSMPVGAIAAQVGYDNYSYFSRLFKRNVGITPAEYRRNNKLLQSSALQEP